jgi:hypothetical protein
MENIKRLYEKVIKEKPKAIKQNQIIKINRTVFQVIFKQRIVMILKNIVY